MSVTSITHLIDFLDDLGVKAKRSLSQNFLIDRNITKKIVASAHIGPDDVVLEIGPGPGGLTEELLATGALVICIEKDETFAKALSRLPGRLEVFSADVLEFDIASLLKKELKEGKRAKVVSNLPYQITTPILALLLPQGELIESVTVMVQKEVGKRFIGKPNSADYSSISVFLNFYSQVKYLFSVAPTCFFPKPNVDSAIIQLQLNAEKREVDEASFFKLTRRAFNQRRKMLRASLKELFTSEKVEQALSTLGLPIFSRPQELSLEQFISLHNTLHQ